MSPRKPQKRARNWREKLLSDGTIPTHGTPFIDVIPVSPLLSEIFLKRYNTLNRSMKKQVIRKVLSDILNDDWRTTHQCMAFSYEGVMLDGQNRFEAIRQSGKTVLARIAFNEPHENARAIDSGAPRNELDDSAIFGLNLTQGMVSAAKAILRYGVSPVRRSYSRKQVEDFCDSLREGLTFADSELVRKARARRGIGVASVAAAIAKAYYHVDRAKLSDFCEVLTSGVCYESKFHAAILLRDWLGNAYSKGLSGDLIRKEMHLKALRAIQAVMREEELRRLYVAQADTYPVQERHMESIGM